MERRDGGGRRLGEGEGWGREGGGGRSGYHAINGGGRNRQSPRNKRERETKSGSKDATEAAADVAAEEKLHVVMTTQSSGRQSKGDVPADSSRTESSEQEKANLRLNSAQPY